LNIPDLHEVFAFSDFFNLVFPILYSNHFLSAKKSLEKENPTKDEFKKQLLWGKYLVKLVRVGLRVKAR